MTKFMLVYNGAATPTEEMTPEAGQKVAEGWKAWMEKVGDALVDVGSPMANGKAIVDDGSAGTATALSGYSIVQAENMDEALKLADGHPFLAEGKGNFSVEVHELLPTPDF